MTSLYDELSRVTTYEYSREDVVQFEALHEEIRALKRERNAVIVAHNYYRPEILKVADFVGDSLELAQKATTVDADVIVFCGVHFMLRITFVSNTVNYIVSTGGLSGFAVRMYFFRQSGIPMTSTRLTPAITRWPFATRPGSLQRSGTRTDASFGSHPCWKNRSCSPRLSP